MSTLQTTILKHPDSGTNNIQFDSSGNVGIGGISSPARKLHVHQASSDGCDLVFTNTTTGDSAGNGFEIGISNSEHAVLWNYENTDITFATNNTERLRINSSGNCGIGNQNPQAKLHLGSTSGTILKLQSSAASTYTNFINNSNALGFIGYEGDSLGFYTNNLKHFQIDTDGTIKFSNSSSERLRVDSSGRLLVGLSTARTGFFNSNSITPHFQVETNGPSDDGRFMSLVSNPGASSGYVPTFLFGKSRSTVAGNSNLIADNDEIGAISFQGADGSHLVESARITAQVDGTTAADDMPGRLVFSTTADGNSAPTEGLRITNGGFIKASSKKGFQLNGYYVILDNTWRTVDDWSTDGNKAGGASILAISSNHTGTVSGKSNLSLHHLRYDGNPGANTGIVNNFGLDIRNNAGDLQIKGFDSGTGLNTQGYVTLIYSDSRQHIDN